MLFIIVSHTLHAQIIYIRRGVCDSLVRTLGCVFIDNETHKNNVTMCTGGEVWSAFSLHHPAKFSCFCHTLMICDAQIILIYVMKYV